MTVRLILRMSAVGVLVACTGLAYAQKSDKAPVIPPGQAGHHEVPNDQYVPVPRDTQRTTPGGRYERDGYVSVQVNVNAFGQNIVGDAANEPTIAVDPNDHSRMVIGWRQFDSVNNDFRQAGYAYTDDSGASWTFPGVIEPGIFRSDPVLDVDSQGNFYYNSLTAAGNDFWCHVYKSTDGGATWDAGTYAYGGDKQWMVIDRTGGVGDGNMYAYWTQYWSICYPGHFTRSANNGQSFESCVSVPNSPQWGTLAVGPDGELYVAGDGFTVSRSPNAQYAGQTIQWDVTSSPNLDGNMTMSGGPNPGGLLGQLWIAVDCSNGPNRGNVYVLSSVDRSSTSDPLDVMFARSTNGGQTWSPPVRINTDVSTSNYQWFGTMSVAPNGRIDVIWLDTRGDPGGYDSELYYCSSEDGGVTWSPNEALTPSFDPHIGWPQQNKMGDYFHMVSDDMGADLAYAGTFNGEQDVYYVRIGETCSDAGTIGLDRAKYACESVAEMRVNDCGLNTDDGVAETVTVAIDSDSEPAGESVLLTETGPATALFDGTIQLSGTNSPGVLQINVGDTVTATYIDADDGQGNYNVVVTDTAIVDCTPPVISNVQATNIEAREATITFTTDEPAQGTVRYGLSCGALTGTAVGGANTTAHAVNVTGLNVNQTYFYAVDAADEAGNVTTDDNGGACYVFMTPDIPDFFTEQFTSGVDLANLSLIFTPDGSSDSYRGCVESITSLPTDPIGGTVLSLSDDDYETVNLSGGATVSLYGSSYSTFYVSSNGFITFTGGDTDYSESLTDHFEQPRISALFDDLNPPSGGTISYRQLADRVAVTYQNVPEYSNTGANTFQVEMHFNGVITISYLSLTCGDAIAGLSEGLGTSPDYVPSDLSEMGSCVLTGDLDCDGDVDFDDINPFVLALSGEAAYYAAYPDCNWLNADCDTDGDVDFDDINPFVALLGSMQR